jgi:hypothetical protein
MTRIKSSFLSGAEGEYEPSFFIIRINSDDSVDECLVKNRSVFVHEYIHFLQDLILPYCIREGLVRLAKFFDRKDFYLMKKEIRLPDNNVLIGEKLTSRQSDFTWGDSDFIDSIDGAESFECVSESVVNYDFKLYKYYIIFSDGRKYHFGARDLLEYIAYKIESKHFPSDEELPDIPYRTVDFFFKKNNIDCMSDNKKMAIIEYCLINDNPVRRLFVIVDDIKILSSRMNINIFSDVDDERFLNFLYGINPPSKGVPPETLSKKIDRRVGRLSLYLDEKFSKEDFNFISDWLDIVMKYVACNIAGKSFFYHLFSIKSSDFNREIDDIFYNIGAPLIVNNSGEMRSFLSNNDLCDESKKQFIQFLLTYEFEHYLSRKDPQCPMCGVCEKNDPSLMDSNCMNAPFRRAFQGKSCPFGKFVKAHGFDKVTWYADGVLIPSEGTHWDDFS